MRYALSPGKGLHAASTIKACKARLLYVRGDSSRPDRRILSGGCFGMSGISVGSFAG